MYVSVCGNNTCSVYFVKRVLACVHGSLVMGVTCNLTTRPPAPGGHVHVAVLTSSLCFLSIPAPLPCLLSPLIPYSTGKHSSVNAIEMTVS